MLFMLVFLLQRYGEAQGVPPQERAVLLELFEATGGEQWTDKEGWAGPPGTECSWKGVSCWPVSGSDHWRVTALALDKNGLRGRVPASVAALKYLSRLDLRDNIIASPLPEELLQLWDGGRLEISYGGPLTDVEEIRLSLLTNVYCANELIVLTADGTVQFYRERCRKPRSANPKPYCELVTAETQEFSRLARYLIGAGFFGAHERQSLMGSWVDVGIVTVTLKGSSGVRAVEVFPNGDDTVQSWSYEKEIRGTIQDLEWGKPRVLPHCPWP